MGWMCDQGVMTPPSLADTGDSVSPASQLSWEEADVDAGVASTVRAAHPTAHSPRSGGLGWLGTGCPVTSGTSPHSRQATHAHALCARGCALGAGRGLGLGLGLALVLAHDRACARRPHRRDACTP